MKEWLRRHVFDPKWGFGRSLFRVPILPAYMNLLIKTEYMVPIREVLYAPSLLLAAVGFYDRPTDFGSDDT